MSRLASLGILGGLVALGLVGRSPAQNLRTEPTQKGDRGSIWSFQVDPVDKRMQVRARIWWSKKKELFLECDHADLHTEKGMFQASGKVMLEGDHFEGRCDRLLIALAEDRIQLEGNAEIVLLKPQPYHAKDMKGVPPDRELLVELKGPQLTLRWPELTSKQAGKDAGKTLKPLPPLDPFDKKNEKK